MSIIINVNMNVKKIEKERLYVGDKGVYLDATIVLFEQPDQFGNDGMIVQNISKEEREKGMKSIPIGSVKYPIKKALNKDDLPF